ncbi:carbohydrate-binding protein [Chitinibacter sp. FCG-7]|uniref:Carbohydrate-binding protein n=1 Tax=Chitinibacter mangrovi TaxID=3153927 RepID=A0AAU7FBH4_9NEIS
MRKNTLRSHTGSLLCMALFSSTLWAAQPWQEGRQYQAGEEVSYQGLRYQARVKHEALMGAGWNPQQAPSLWTLVKSGAGSASSTSGTVSTAGATACPASWASSATYTTGNQVSYNGRTYEAKWWTKGDTPGTTGEWGVWKDLGVCGGSAATAAPASNTPVPTAAPTLAPTLAPTAKPSAAPTSAPTVSPAPTAIATAAPTPASSCFAAWLSSKAYVGGDKVTYNGRNYQAQWWTQGNPPDTNTGSGKPWLDLGVCGASPATATPVSNTPAPTAVPTAVPSATPTIKPSATPTASPVATAKPTLTPTATPTAVPTATPAVTPTPTATPQASAAPSLGLVINEIASDPNGSGSWFEIRNGSASSVNLSDVKLRIRNNAGVVSEYPLGAITLPAEGLLAVAARNSATGLTNTSQIVYLGQTSNYPRWTSASGAIELVRNGQTVDFVRFGSSSDQPLSAGQWSGSNAPALSASYGYALVRPYLQGIDSNTAADWQNVAFSTPGGRNDVPSGVTDEDGDGIPSSAKVPGGTYAGLDLYSMGARAGRPTLLIHVDTMQTTDEGVKPQREALQAVVDAFARRNIDILFDVGSMYTASFSPANFNLGGGKMVAFAACVDLNPASGCSRLADYKAASMDLRRRQVFHYLLMASSRNADGSSGSSGVAEIGGNDFIVSLGKWGLNSNTASNRYRLINYQAGTIMHELGHNLGLRHGGFENTNDKPNYYSIMNYLYQLQGLGDRATSIGPVQRYYLDKGYNSLSTCSLEGSACSSTFRIDYSDGSSERLNENSLLEAASIGRGADSGVYADWNNSKALNSSAYALDVNGDGVLGYLQDYDDWGNISLRFARTSQGSAGAAMLRSINSERKQAKKSRAFMHDQFEHSEEKPPRPEFFHELRKASPYAQFD